ncbi:MFS transporter [Glycomyces albidus]|uniref:MFS transporter n=1 Tax=Glycomyces albidus TaxID=2656774 RepID=A0A6L5G9A5_9ACTN|nr:MFS transporter [Glycomyces albidus]MQM26163.1 MFS transporter [Glycomyces albidus]
MTSGKSDHVSSRTAMGSLAGAVLLLGIADSMVGSYLVLFASDQLRLDPLRVGIISSATAVGGIAVSWLLGRWFDRSPARWYTVAVAAASAVGLVLASRAASFEVLLLFGLTLLGSMAAAFPQLFAMARLVLGAGPVSQRSAPLLRSCWSTAWAIGPLLGAAVLSRSSYSGLLLTAAGVLVLVALVSLTVPPPRGGPTAEPEPDGSSSQPRSGAVAWFTTSVTLFFTAMFAGSVALPLYATRSLEQSPSSVGVLFSVCAVVEVAAALGLAAVPARIGQRALILSGMAAFVAYFGLVILAQGMPLLIIAQVARGFAIAVVGAAGIRFFQDLLAPATGRATTLFSNASTAGSLVAGVLTGLSIGRFGYSITLALCGAVAATAAAAFIGGTAAHRPVNTRTTALQCPATQDRGVRPGSSDQRSRRRRRAASTCCQQLANCDETSSKATFEDHRGSPRLRRCVGTRASRSSTTVSTGTVVSISRVAVSRRTGSNSVRSAMTWRRSAGLCTERSPVREARRWRTIAVGALRSTTWSKR